MLKMLYCLWRVLLWYFAYFFIMCDILGKVVIEYIYWSVIIFYKGEFVVF